MRKVVLLFASLLMWIGCALGQQRTVTGVVTSVEDGAPLIQLAVQVKGTQTGVVTDADGRYTIRVAGPESVLVFTYTGYETQEVTVGEQQTINVVMQLANEEIDEVMVVAFGKAKKSTFTGSAASVSGKELERKQVSNVLNALSGKVPGVTVSSSNNQPGTSSTVRIRGNGSFSASSSPLYVVDGVPFDGDISSINPADVESTVLLKDAASAALYGARAANGVVMITTKSGANAKNAGMANINFAAKLGYNFRGIPAPDRITDPKKYAEKYYEAVWNAHRYNEKNKDLSDEEITKLADKEIFDPTQGFNYFPFHIDDDDVDFPTAEYDGARWFTQRSDGTWAMNPNAKIGRTYIDHKDNDTKYWLQPDDWEKESIHPAQRQEYNLSLSGRSDKVNYFLSSGYLNDKGYTENSDYTRYTIRLRGDYKPKKWLNMGANISYTGSQSNAIDPDNDGTVRDLWGIINYMAPLYPMYVRDGNKQKLYKNGMLVYDYGTGEFPMLPQRYNANANPLAQNIYDYHYYDVNIIGMRSYVDFLLPYDFKLTMNVGYDADNTYYTETMNPFYGEYAGSQGGNITKQFDRASNLNLQQLLTWSHAYDQHHIDVLLGHEYSSRTGQNLYGSKDNLFHYKTKELSGAINNDQTGSSITQYRVEGYLGRAQYDFAEKYFLTLSFRRDGSSRFAKNRRWGNFWSVGASWMLSSESFMESTRSFLDLLKLKASYGVQGNDNLPSTANFPYTDLYRVRNLNDKFSLSFASKGNPNLTWETSHNLNVGVEFAFFRHRLTGGVEFYRREVTDMLFQLTVPPSSGYSSYWDNIGSMSNTGVDFELRGVPYKSKNIEWSVFVNGGHVTNKLTKLPAEWNRTTYGHVDGYNVYKEGGSLYDLLLPKWAGVNEQGQATWKLADGSTTTDWNKASEIENRTYFKDLSAKLVGGFGTSVDFYGFDFSAAFGYALGGRRIDGSYRLLMNPGILGRAMHKDLLESWSPNKKGKYVRMEKNSYASATSDYFLTSRSYLSIDNLTLGYTFKKEWLDRIGLGSLRLYVVADNVWLFSARKGFDPRFTRSVGYKAMRTISGGLTLTF